MTPCNYIHDYISDVGDTISQECEYDPVKQFEYLSTVRIVVLHNSERLNPEKFGEDSIVRESKMISKQIDPYTPNYHSIYVRLNELEDETQFFQYGKPEYTEYVDVSIDEPGFSSWSDNLIEKPGGRYKYTSMEVNFNQD